MSQTAQFGILRNGNHRYFTFTDMAENLQKEHLPFVVHISKENIEVFCNNLLFVYAYLMKFY